MTKRAPRINYLSNENLLREISLSRERLRSANISLTPAEALTPALVQAINLLVDGVAIRPNWRNYSYIEDMKAEARYLLCRNALKFDETKTQNPFSYYTQIVWSSFLNYLDNEKNVGRIRDALLEKQAAMPSFRRQQEDQDEQRQNCELVYALPGDSEESASLVEQIGLANAAILALNDITVPREELLAQFQILFGRQIDQDIFDNVQTIVAILPQQTDWSVCDGPAGLGVSRVLQVRRGQTKLIKGLRADQSDLPGKLLEAALALYRDYLIEKNGGTGPSLVQWGARNGPQSGAKKRMFPQKKKDPV